MSSNDNVRLSTLKINAVSAIILQIVTAIVGIFLPRFILNAFGSEVNGLISSITQFLSYITLMEAGTGGVVRAALYRPLVNRDNHTLSVVLNSTQKFFRIIAYVFLGYMVVLAIVYPFFVTSDTFSYEYIFSLVLILGITTFSQYYFCLTYRILLQADQKIYYDNLFRLVTLVANFIICVFLIHVGANIHVVKLVSATVFLITPVAINIYVQKKYNIDKKVKVEKGVLKQSTDGLAHHVAFFVHKNTDIAILSFFSSYKEISVYAVYNMIVTAIQGMLSSISSSVTSKFGELFAKDDRSRLETVFSQYETLNFFATTLLFSITGIMILPFIEFYTIDITDANYIRPFFALLIIVSEFIYSVRAPYSNLCFAVGEFKGTRRGAFLEATLNIVLSIVFVVRWGIVGVAVGTLIAMCYRTLDYVLYLRKHIIYRHIKYFIKNTTISVASFATVFALCQFLILPIFDFTSLGIWAICAVIVSVITLITNLLFQIIFNKSSFLSSLKFFKN